MIDNKLRASSEQTPSVVVCLLYIVHSSDHPFAVSSIYHCLDNVYLSVLIDSECCPAEDTCGRSVQNHSEDSNIFDSR